jgi:hypothetical protein
VGGVLETAGSGRGVRPAGETLAEVLITERYRRRLTQEQLAAKAGVSRDTLSELERGRPRLNGRAVGKVSAENVANADFIESGVVPEGTSFVTRSAPGIGENEGGGIEVVVGPGGVQSTGFSYLGPKGLEP